MNDNYTLNNSPYINSNLSFSTTSTNERFDSFYTNEIERYPAEQSMGPYPPSGYPGGPAPMSYRPMDPRYIPDRRTPLNYLPKKVRDELMYFLNISRCEGGWEDVAERLGFPRNEINDWGAKRDKDSHCAADLLINKCLKSACCDKTIERFLHVLYQVESWAAYELLLQALPEAVRIHLEETKSSLEVAAIAGATKCNPPPVDEEDHPDSSPQMPHQQGQRKADESSFYYWEQNHNGFQGGRQIHVLLTYCCERPRQMEHVDNLYDCLRKNNFSVSHERNESQKLARDKLGWLDSQFHRADYILVLITPEYARDVSNHINLPQIINRTLPNSQSEKSVPSSDQSQNVKRDRPGHESQITSLNNQSESYSSLSSLATQCSSLPNKSESALHLNTLHQSQSTPVIIDPSDRCLNARYIYKLMHMQYFTSNSVNKRYIPVLMPTAIKYSTGLKISPRKLIPGWLEHTLVYTWPKDYKDLLYYMMKPDKVLRQFVSSNQPKQVITVTHS